MPPKQQSEGRGIMPSQYKNSRLKVKTWAQMISDEDEISSPEVNNSTSSSASCSTIPNNTQTLVDIGTIKVLLLKAQLLIQ